MAVENALKMGTGGENTARQASSDVVVHLMRATPLAASEIGLVIRSPALPRPVSCDLANPAGNLVVDLVSDDAVWRSNPGAG